MRWVCSTIMNLNAKQDMKTIAMMLLPMLVILLSCKPREAPPLRNNEVLVDTVAVREISYSQAVRTTGLLGTSAEMKLSFKTGGIIASIPVREGQEVQEGEELARLDLAEIKARVTQARIGQDKAKRDLDRARNLYEDSVVTLEQYQNARSAYELARSQRQVADFNLKHSTIKAPTRGKVQKLLVESNELISPGYPVVLFASTENDWVVRASIPDKDIVTLRLGDSAGVFMDPFPGKRFPGEIAELGSVADPVSGTYEVEVRLLRQDPQFRSGFICRVQLLPAEHITSLALPIQCLVNASDRRADVFVYENGRVSRRRIRTGALFQEQVEVVEGLSPGERVVSEGARYLKGGEQVHIKKDRS